MTRLLGRVGGCDLELLVRRNPSVVLLTVRSNWMRADLAPTVLNTVEHLRFDATASRGARR